MRTLDRPSVEMVCPGSNAADQVRLGGGAKTYPVMRPGSAVYLDPRPSSIERLAVRSMADREGADDSL